MKDDTNSPQFVKCGLISFLRRPLVISIPKYEYQYFIVFLHVSTKKVIIFSTTFFFNDEDAVAHQWLS